MQLASTYRPKPIRKVFGSAAGKSGPQWMLSFKSLSENRHFMQFYHLLACRYEEMLTCTLEDFYAAELEENLRAGELL